MKHQCQPAELVVASLGDFRIDNTNICEEWERCVGGPVGWHRGVQQTSYNTPKTIFCALVCNDLFKNHGCEKVMTSQFAYQ